jgi:hypothetical protein
VVDTFAKLLLEQESVLWERHVIDIRMNLSLRRWSFWKQRPAVESDCRVGGTLTGRGGDIIVIDDPLKPDDALSETKRLAANQWFTNTLLSRLDDKRTGAIVVVMQRVHIDDLTGFLLAQSDEWDVLSLPAIADADELIPLSAERSYRRKQGEALSPEREPLTVLNALKLQIGSDAFSAQYQQAPAPPGGAMVKRAWIRRFSELPPLPARLFTTINVTRSARRSSTKITRS